MVMPPPMGPPPNPNKKRSADARSTPPPEAAPPETQGKKVEVFDLLRELRAEIQDLQLVLKSVRQGEASLASNADYIKKTMKDIFLIMETLSKGEYGQYADYMRHMQNLWERMGACPVLVNPTQQFAAQDQEKYLNGLEGIFRSFVYDIGYLTIPARVKEWLRASKPGFYVPFHEVFDDELPDAADRNKLLNALYYQPDILDGGLVEPDTGLIYRYSTRTDEFVGHYLLLAASVALAIGIIAVAAFAPMAGWPLKSTDLSTLLIGWIAVVAGLIVHVIVGVAKRTQSNNRPPIMAISQMPRLLDAKLGQVLFKILLTVVGLLGLVFAAGIENAKFFNAFLVGYSLDSVIELLSATLDQKAGARIAALKQQLGSQQASAQQ